MLKKIAAIDIGTNSMRLLVAEVEGGQILKKKKTVYYTRIGEGVNKTRRINEAAFERNLRALETIKEICMEEEVDDYMIFGTSALRDASNGGEFIAAAKRLHNMDIRILTGKEEASYGLLGVSSSLHLQDMLIMDVGGGSTELVMVSKEVPVFLKSVDVGAVRMKEMFIRNDPPLENEIGKLELYVKNKIGDSLNEIATEGEMVGIGGTATTLSSMIQEMECYDPDRINGSRVSRKELTELIEKMKTMNYEERVQITGLDEKRADIILAGMVIVKAVLEATGKDHFIVSDSDNLEGSIYARLTGESFSKNH